MRRAIGFVFLALVLGACAKNSSNTSAATQLPLSTATPASSSAASPSATPVIADGRSFGYIHSVNTTYHNAVFDLAQFFTGPAADKAAQDDGQVGPGQHVDNDYYIRNQNKKLRTIPYSTSVSIRIVNWAHCCELKDGAIVPFAASFAGGKSDEYHGPDSGYWLTVSGGTITKIEEQYQP